MRNIFLEKSYKKCAAHINANYCEKTVKKQSVMNQHIVLKNRKMNCNESAQNNIDLQLTKYEVKI